MRFDVKKAENCFKDSRSYEYSIPVDGQSLTKMLDGWQITEHHKYRRPMFTADKGGINIKGILKANLIKVSYTENNWQTEKDDFESWLSSAGACADTDDCTDDNAASYNANDIAAHSAAEG